MGGVAGHLNHIHENLDFTFGEIKNVLFDVAHANIEVIEKVDGQNMFFTYHVGKDQILTARNSGDIKKGGMTPSEFALKWANHPNQNVQQAFMNGFYAIARAIDYIDPSLLLKIFGDKGQNYINTEIMYTKNPNIINYGGDWIVLHNLYIFHSDGTKTIETGDKFSLLVDAVQTAEGEIDSKGWKISGPQIVNIKDISDGTAYDTFTSTLDLITGMSDDATIGDYVTQQLRIRLTDNIPINQQEDVINTIIGAPNSKNIKELKKEIPKSYHKRLSAIATKTNSRKIISLMVGPIEKVISDFAIEVLRGLESFFLVGDHDKEIVRMRNELKASIAKLENAPADNAEKAGKLLKKQLGKLGDIENIASTMEGIVFEYPSGSKVLYKLTGTFAMVNQIIGHAYRV